MTFNFIKSLSLNWWKLEPNETVFFIFFTSTFCWTKVDSNRYLSLLATIFDPTLSEKNTSSNGVPFASVPIPSLIPITLRFFLTTNTVEGILEIVDPDVVAIPIGLPSFVTVIFWFVTKGWFSRYIPLDGIVLVFLVSPNEKLIDLDWPDAVVPKPTALIGLKNTLSLTVELNLSTDFSIVNESGMTYKGVVTECAKPGLVLSTVMMFGWSYVFKTVRVSIPTRILSPTDTWDAMSV